MWSSFRVCVCVVTAWTWICFWAHFIPFLAVFTIAWHMHTCEANYSPVPNIHTHIYTCNMHMVSLWYFCSNAAYVMSNNGLMLLFECVCMCASCFVWPNKVFWWQLIEFIWTLGVSSKMCSGLWTFANYYSKVPIGPILLCHSPHTFEYLELPQLKGAITNTTCIRCCMLERSDASVRGQVHCICSSTGQIPNIYRKAKHCRRGVRMPSCSCVCPTWSEHTLLYGNFQSKLSLNCIIHTKSRVFLLNE